MSVFISTESRLRFSSLITVDGIEFWDLGAIPPIAVQEDEIKYRVVDLDTVDSLARKFYGSETYWWVIAIANSLDILPTDLKPGSEIRIPSKSYIETLFLSLRPLGS